MSKRTRSAHSSELAILDRQIHLKELALKERELAAVEGATRTIEALESISQYNYVDPREWRTDAYGREAAPVSTTNDRRDGRNSPFVETEQDLALVRGMARLVTGTTCAGSGIVENLTNYVIGKGFEFTAATKKRKSAPPELVAAVQDVIDEFLDDNDWTGDLDRELFRRSVRDGEFFLSLYPTPAGHTLARVVEPEYVTGNGAPPLSDRELEEMGIRHAVNWTFGVCAADHDVNTVHGYAVQWDSLSCDFLPVGTVEHFRGFNVDRNVKRGLSDFYPAWQWLNRHEKVAKNTAEGAAIQAAIAFIRQHVAGTRKSDVESMRDAKADYTVSARTGSGGTRTDHYRHFEPGTILDTPKGMEHMPGPMGAERGEAFISVAAKILRMVGSRWAMPEYMISGDASNANFASTKEAGTPFVGLVEARQAAMKGRFLRVIWRVLEIAAAAGRFQKFGNLGLYGAIERLVEIQCEPPTVVKADPVQETTRRQILHMAGVLSKKDWQTQEGIDPELQSSIDARPAAGGDGGMDDGAGTQPDAGTGAGPDVQGTALNGAQVTSLVAVVAQVSAGTLPKDSAKAIIGAAFPLLRPDQLASIIDPVIAGSVAADGEPGPNAGGAGNGAGDTGDETTGAYLGLKRSEWKNARKAITDILGEVARGETSVSAARVFLGGLGLAAAGIDKLLADAGDGKLDTRLPESAAPVIQPTAADRWLSRVMEKAWGAE